jgi:hypothetical protein
MDEARRLAISKQQVQGHLLQASRPSKPNTTRATVLARELGWIV